jgi:hypothetical protein
MKITIIESPYAGDVETNVRYARACVKDSVMKGEAPLASHLLYTQLAILDDTIPEERAAGMRAGVEMYRVADLCAVYIDLGISRGMSYGIREAQWKQVPIEYRTIGVDKCITPSSPIKTDLSFVESMKQMVKRSIDAVFSWLGM